jgi:hypothetical protein
VIQWANGFAEGGRLEGRLGSGINLFEGPSLVEVFAQVPKESHNIAICARIALLFHFTICLLSVSASFILPLNKVGFVWLKHRLARRGHMGPFGRLRQTHILVDATCDSPRPDARWWSRQLFWQRGRGSGRLGLSALDGAEGFLLPDVSSCWSGRRASCFASSSERSSGGECPKALSCA